MTHPVQYYEPWFHHIAESCPEIDLSVIYATEPDAQQQGVGFGKQFVWDVALREGYRKRVLRLKNSQPVLYGRLRLHFFGTSNQTNPKTSPQRVLPVAREFGVDDIVTETAWRIDYLDALTVQTQATAILMMGSSERHCTASKLYPGLLSRRPILAVYYQASSVAKIVVRAGRPPSLRVVTYDDGERAESCVPQLADALAQLVANPAYSPADVDLDVMREFSASALSRKLAELLDLVTQHRASAQHTYGG